MLFLALRLSMRTHRDRSVPWGHRGCDNLAKRNRSCRRVRVKVTTDRVPDHLSELVHGVSLREDGMAQSVSFVAAFGRLLDSKDDFGPAHCL